VSLRQKKKELIKTNYAQGDAERERGAESTCKVMWSRCVAIRRGKNHGKMIGREAFEQYYYMLRVL
jgi:hypothetical protein